jgi:hypothetical protein
LRDLKCHNHQKKADIGGNRFSFVNSAVDINESARNPIIYNEIFLSAGHLFILLKSQKYFRNNFHVNI